MTLETLIDRLSTGGGDIEAPVELFWRAPDGTYHTFTVANVTHQEGNGGDVEEATIIELEEV